MNIINAAFVRNGVTVRTLPVYQYDSGMILNISGLDDLPSTFRVDFSNAETGQSKTVIGTDGQVHVPYEYFVPGATIHCWLVWTGADYAVTRKHIMIPVARRATPTDEEPTPDEQGVIDQAIAALNDAVEHTGQDVEAAAGYAEQAEQSAQAATDAKDAAVAAKDQAVESADEAAASAQSASESAQSAFQSKTDAQAAAASVAGAMNTLEATIQADLQAAKESGMFDGADGVSPTVTVTPITDGHQVMITDAEGEHTFDVTNGEPGTDGFSPVATVTKTQTGATISITDKAGTTTAQISNGAKGDPGDDYVLTAQDKAEIAQQAEELLAPVLDEKAAAIHTAAGPAPIVSIPDAAAAPVDALTVGIEPVQDLHGYDNPWPAGGGKNLLDWDKVSISGTHYGMTFAKGIAEGTVTISGTLTSSGSVAPISYADNTLSGKGYVFLTEHISGNSVIDLSRTYGFRTESEKAVAVFLSGTTGQSYTETIRVSVYAPPVPSAWSPYSNICPITGWTGAKVSRTGKNMINPSELVYSAGGNNVYYRFFPPHNTDFVFSTDSIITGLYVQYKDSDEMPSLLEPGWSEITYKYNTTSLGFNSGSHKWYRLMTYEINGVIRDRLYQLELGTTATAYEPYQGETYDITFPTEAGTVYGGTLDVTNGVLTVDRAMVDLGTLRWDYISPTSNIPYGAFYANVFGKAKKENDIVCSAYPLSTNYFRADKSVLGNSASNTVYVIDSSYADTTTFASAMSGVQLVYELAAPITYTLTPQEIRTLLGANNIWADTGDVTVGYKADTKLYIDNKITQAIAAALNS